MSAEIIGGEVFAVTVPTRREHTWASNTKVPIGQHALLRLDTGDGFSGWGEAPALATWGGAAMRYYGETPQTVNHVVSDLLLPALIGLDPVDIAVIHATMDQIIKGHPYAKAMVDMACHDAAGKALGVPVYKLLGGAFRDRIEVAHSLGLMPVEKCAAEAAEAVSEGVKTIKCKTGIDAERDIEVVAQVRKVAPDVRIRVDGNEGYRTTWEAINTTRAQERHGIFICEQPVAGAAGLAEVARRIDTAVMADESAWTVADILELKQLGAAACFSCYVTKPGGLYRAKQQADVAAAMGMECDIGGSIELGIGNAANLHLGAALPNAILASVCPVTTVAGGDGPEIAGIYYRDDIVSQSFDYEDGCVLVPEGPGLGIEVDVEKVRAYSA